jgi:hypothetical protein
MNPIKQVLQIARTTQKEVCEKLEIPQATMSHRMNNEIQGSIEWSIEVAKELNVKSFKLVKKGYIVSVKIK